MMTEQEAIDIIQQTPLFRQESGLTIHSDLFNALALACIALEKQTGEKMDNKETLESRIAEEIKEEYKTVYCYNCQFNAMEEEKTKEECGYYPCEYCHRKNMSWTPSDASAYFLANKILKLIGEDKK